VTVAVVRTSGPAIVSPIDVAMDTRLRTPSDVVTRVATVAGLEVRRPTEFLPGAPNASPEPDVAG
jgi:hypothetical protein